MGDAGDAGAVHSNVFGLRFLRFFFPGHRLRG